MSKANETVELLDYMQEAIEHKMSKLDAKSAEYEQLLRLDVAISRIENAVLCYVIDKKGTFLQGVYDEMENRNNETL